MKSEAEAISFIDESSFALKQLYVSLNERLNILNQLKEELEKQLNEINRRHQVEDTIFREEDQWSDAANYYHARYVERVIELRSQSTKVQEKINDLSDDTKQREIYAQTLARLGATESALDMLAAGVLQIGKQSLSFRFGKTRPNLAGVRSVGGQSVVDVIWEGRNNGMHWEDGNPFQRVTDMLNQLNADFGTSLTPDKNNALPVIEALGWTDADKVVDELKTLVQATVV